MRHFHLCADFPDTTTLRTLTKRDYNDSNKTMGKAMPFVTFLLGCIVFFGWLLFTKADETGISILRQSLLWFLLLPILLLIPLAIAASIVDLALADILPPALRYVATIFGMVLFEEAIKLSAARDRRSGIQAFALVSLYGIYELALIRPFMVWGVSASENEIFWFQISVLPAMALHVLTAAIYAFHFRQSPAIQLSICSGIHFLFNIAALQSNIAYSPIWPATIIPLAAAAWLLVPARGSMKRGDWQLERTELAELK